MFAVAGKDELIEDLPPLGVVEFYRVALEATDVVSVVDLLGPHPVIPEKPTPVEDLLLYFLGRNSALALNDYSLDKLLSAHEDEPVQMDALVFTSAQHTNIAIEFKTRGSYSASRLALSPFGAALRHGEGQRGFANTFTRADFCESPRTHPSADEPAVIPYLASPTAKMGSGALLAISRMEYRSGRDRLPLDTCAYLPDGFKQVSWKDNDNWQVDTAGSMLEALESDRPVGLAAAVLQGEDHPSVVYGFWG